jgi:hypothetical protein
MARKEEIMESDFESFTEKQFLDKSVKRLLASNSQQANHQSMFDGNVVYLKPPSQFVYYLMLTNCQTRGQAEFFQYLA